MKNKKKIICIVQARLNSTRLKNKVIHKFKNKTMIEILLERLKTSKLINEIIVAIPKSDKKLEDILKEQIRSLSRK